MEPKRSPNVSRRVTGRLITLRPERPSFHHLQVTQPSELRDGQSVLIVKLVDELEVSLVRVVGPPRKSGGDLVVDIVRLVAAGLDKPDRISLAEHSVIPMGDSWSGSACIIKTGYGKLLKSGNPADLLTPADREKLQKQVITFRQLEDLEEVTVDLDET